jgi:hypothetical protein
MFNEGGEIELFKRLNFNAVFYASVISGSRMPNLMYMTSYESKADRLAYKYNYKTMFIEYECNGVGSGISTTQADYWFYFMVKPGGDYIVYEIPIAKLREACNGCRQVSGGDGGRAKGYIVPVLEEFKI